MTVLVLAVLGVVGGGLLIAVSVLVPGGLLSRPIDDPLPPATPTADADEGAP